MITAPSTPPASISAPSVPASVGVKPRGRMMFSTQVLMPLKMPMPMNETSRYSQKGLTLRACLRPSSIRARTSWPGGQGGVGGFSRARTMKSTAEKAAIPPYRSCTAGMDRPPSVNTGVSTIPSAVPTRLASVTRPTAVARSWIENQLAGTFVQALSRKGCAAAMPTVLHSTRL